MQILTPREVMCTNVETRNQIFVSQKIQQNTNIFRH